MDRIAAYIAVFLGLLALLCTICCQHRPPEIEPAEEEFVAPSATFSPPVMVAAPINTDTSDKTYKLGPKDELTVVISGKGGYRQTVDVTVLPQGTVMLPMVNEVRASGLTISGFAREVEMLLGKDYLVSPEVFVTLKNRKSHPITIVGEMVGAGTYYLQAETETLKDIIVRSGGPTNGFNKTVFLIRLPESATDIGQAPETAKYTVNLLDLMSDPKGDLNVPVLTGDIIYVLSGEQAAEFSGLERGNVLVFGEVKNPGIVPYTKGLTVLRAILKAGNFTEEAAKSRVQIKRTTEGGVITLKVNINEIIEGGDQSADIPLQPGDVVHVPRSLF
ncbi:MAG: SLBB domain-containing protein [Candidatus Coatesbacteria bacterium]|nr:SLBB domain-containing protein [Candidatus Coatesbacteria bacterium]